MDPSPFSFLCIQVILNWTRIFSSDPRDVFIGLQTYFKTHLGSVWIWLILLKLKIYCWNHCSKIIFKCINSTVGPIFNEKIDKKWNLWVREQCTDALFTKKVNIWGYCSTVYWTVAALLQKRVKKKKKKKNKTQTWFMKRESKQRLSPIQTDPKLISWIHLLLDFYFIFEGTWLDGTPFLGWNRRIHSLYSTSFIKQI